MTDDQEQEFDQIIVNILYGLPHDVLTEASWPLTCLTRTLTPKDYRDAGVKRGVTETIGVVLSIAGFTDEDIQTFFHDQFHESVNNILSDTR